MFSTIVAYGVFILTSLVFLFLIVDALIPKSELEKTLNKLNAAQNGRSTRLDWRKVGVIFAMWFASGYYLWG